MLKKIVSINNVGKFRKSAAAGDTAFAKRTLIVGANGFGKTTLCAVLRSLKTGEPSNLTGRKTLGATDPPTVEILHDGGTARFDGTTWSSTYPALEVFDGVFVAENVHSGEVVDIERNRKSRRVSVDGRVMVNDPDLAIRAAVDGLGIAYTLVAMAEPFLRSGHLVRVLEDWSPSFEGLYLYYPGHRQVPATLRALIDMIRTVRGSAPSKRSLQNPFTKD
jgi:energy-coupling factor transporter ATP-binding protein EcfA2